MSRSLATILSGIFLSIALGLLCYIGAFYIIDLDFWWHIAAGRVMRATGTLIQTEPFAYTRLGEPYLATQSWLAQIILSVLYDRSGALGLIVFRTVCVALAVTPVFLWRPRYNWLFAPPVVFAVAALRPAILARPQLFSFILFAVSMWLALLWLQRRLSTPYYVGLALVVQVLWVNLHGGAALVHLLLPAALFLQLWRTPRVRPVIALGIGLVLALFASPNFAQTFTYVQLLFTDQTVNFIQEWMPRTTVNYLRWVAPFWVLALVTAWLGRKHLLFTGVVLLALAYFSLQAIRHEPFFILAALLLSVYQLTESDGGRRVLQWAERRWKLVVVGVLALLVAIGWLAYRDKYVATGRLGLSGYGAHEPLRGAYNFVEKAGITGRMFNNYEAGSYLEFRGYPDRPVFVDGRNVDHGYVFLEDLFRAEYRDDVFRRLQETYDFTYAMVYYNYYRDADELPYVSLLNRFADWALVYLDDEAAVYVRRTEHPAIADAHAYTVLEPELLRQPTRILRLPASVHGTLQTELQRAKQQAPSSIRIRLATAALHMAAGRDASAEALLREVQSDAPYNFSSYNLLAVLRVRQERYAEAGALFEQAIRVGGGEDATNMNYDDLAWVFRQAGNEEKAREYEERQ